MKKFGLFLFLFALFSQTSLAFFKDIPEDPKHHYYTSVKWMYENEVVEGYSDNTFKSDQEVNRAEFLKMLYATLDIPVDDVKSVNPFTDVPADEWYTDYVRKAYLDGVIDGYSDRTFRPAQTINFAEASKIIANTFLKEKKFQNPDKNLAQGGEFPYCLPGNEKYVDEWFYKYISQIDGFCIIPEYLNGMYGFSAGQNVTRGDMAEMLYRAKTIRDNFYPGLVHNLNREFEAEILVPAPIGVDISSENRVKVVEGAFGPGFWEKLVKDKLVLKGKVMDYGDYSDDCVEGLGTFCDQVTLRFYIDPIDRWKVYSLLDNFHISDEDYDSLKKYLGENFTIELDEIVNFSEGYAAYEYELTLED